MKAKLEKIDNNDNINEDKQNRLIVFKRVCAYFIDMLIVLAIVNLFLSIEIVNPNQNKIKELTEKFNKLNDEYVTLLSSDNVSSTSTSTNLEDEVIDKANELLVDMTDIAYKINKYRVNENIVLISTLFVYFILFAYFNKGRTVGKRLIGLKVVNNSNSKSPSFIQVFVRGIIFYGILTSTSSLLILLFCSKNVYITGYTSLIAIENIIMIICVCFVLFRKDNRGLHDIIAKTNVIECDSLVKEIKNR